MHAPLSPPCHGVVPVRGNRRRREGYQLGPGDRLRVAVYRHERLSGESTLDATGTLVMPLLGAIPADGLTPRELELEIEEQLQDDGYLRAPHVGIEVMTHRPFYILGEVSRPGEYEHVSGMTLVNAVALAGGYTYRADRTGVTISRGHCVREATAATKVLPGAVIRVPARFF
ncbi:MAG TPA: polysaccharide biosynthesis/export family protein [Geminicoccaceae bacterium]|nr:polysaccharide biosynthesis/export family protein [Geminicoccaceae bacterium]